MKKVMRWWSSFRQILRIRQELPKELEHQFTEFKDIKSIDRIHVAAWIGSFLTICLFGLDYYRYYIEDDWQEYYKKLFLFHLIMLVYFIPAIYIYRKKAWIIQTRLRRGIVIWGMVLVCFVTLLLQSGLIFYYRGTLTMFMGFIFTASWMFAMSHRERIVFFSCTIGFMMGVIIFKTQVPPEILQPDTPEPGKDNTIVNVIEVFFLSLAAFFLDAFDYNLRVTNFLNQLQIEREQKKIRELEEFKTRFFTNLTHEFRTPLTIIMGMAREISDDPARWTKEGTQLIRQHAGNLLHLINQILDLSKIENSALPVRMVQGDVVSFLGYVIDSYKGHALAKHLEVHYLPAVEQLNMDYDPDKLSAIVSNLLSNAIKFTPEGGNVYVSIAVRKSDPHDQVEIVVRDSGIGIPKEELTHIFERFYQADTEHSKSGIGTGIGLSLANELIQLLGGNITVQSASGKGTQFTVTLPVHNVAEPLEAGSIKPTNEHAAYTLVAQNLNVSEEEEDMDTSKPEILIIEDNPDVVSYLQLCLHDLFRIAVCRNGEDGVSKAIEMVPELVLSDVLMPGKDGLAVCRELKKNPVTSHIPIVLLSAKADAASRIAGLESGADVYMLKPFEKDELRAQLRNLIDRFKEYHARYADPNNLPEKVENQGQALEDEFITRVRNVVETHLDNSEFSVNDLERAIFLSRSQLHKKLKALTGLSAMQFVNRIRLSTARDMLRRNDANISEIAYQVGFSDPNYFSRSYSEQFGETPTETRRNHKSN